MNTTRTVHVDLYTKVCLTAIAFLMTLLVLGLWTGGPIQAQRAQAGPAGDPLVVGDSAQTGGIPDTGAQRYAMINGIKDTNTRLDKIVSLLESGKVRVITVDEKGK